MFPGTCATTPFFGSCACILGLRMLPESVRFRAFDLLSISLGPAVWLSRGFYRTPGHPSLPLCIVSVSGFNALLTQPTTHNPQPTINNSSSNNNRRIPLRKARCSPATFQRRGAPITSLANMRRIPWKVSGLGLLDPPNGFHFPFKTIPQMEVKPCSPSISGPF